MNRADSVGARPNVRLTLAINDYDHVRDLVTGKVSVPGIDLTCLDLSVEEIFFRFARHREWEVSELSLGKYCSLRAAGDEGLTAIPVFPSRSFRHAAIFIRADGPVDDPAALAGGRIGIPEWTQTATIWGRGLLQHRYGLDLSAIDWVRGGTNEPGRIEGVPLELSGRFKVTDESERSLGELLVAGDIDALISAHPPDGLDSPDTGVRRLFQDCRAVEEEYFRETGIFPLMHVVALRADVVERYPWAAMNLFEAFEQAKRRSVARALDTNTPRFPVPWATDHARTAVEVFGTDLWPYGIEPNRRALEEFLAMAHEQGVCERRLAPEDLFESQTLERFKV